MRTIPDTRTTACDLSYHTAKQWNSLSISTTCPLLNPFNVDSKRTSSFVIAPNSSLVLCQSFPPFPFIDTSLLVFLWQNHNTPRSCYFLYLSVNTIMYHFIVPMLFFVVFFRGWGVVPRMLPLSRSCS